MIMQDKLLKLWKDVVVALLGTITPHSLRRPKAVLQVCRVIFQTGETPHPSRIKGSQLRPVASRQSDHLQGTSNWQRPTLRVCYHVTCVLLWLTDAEFGEFLDCCPVITEMMSFDYRTDIPWLPERCPFIIGLPFCDYRNYVLWLLDCYPMITGMMSFDYWTALRDYRNYFLWLLDCYPVITGMLSFEY